MCETRHKAEQPWQDGSTGVFNAMRSSQNVKPTASPNAFKRSHATHSHAQQSSMPFAAKRTDPNSSVNGIYHVSVLHNARIVRQHHHNPTRHVQWYNATKYATTST
jgi:hypothetical protein